MTDTLRRAFAALLLAACAAAAMAQEAPPASAGTSTSQPMAWVSNAHSASAMARPPSEQSCAEQISPDHAVLPAVSLPSPGTWTFRVTIVQAGSPLQLTFEVPVR